MEAVRENFKKNFAEIYPFESHFVTVDNLKMHYIDEGSGPVVVLLHGNPTWSFYYRNLILALKENYRVIAPDHIGCGLSDHPNDRHFRALDRMMHLQKLIDELKIKEFSLVMHDWGGPIGTGLAVRNQNAIKHLVYLNTTLSETASLPLIIKRAATPFIGKFLTKKTMRFLKLTTKYGSVIKLPKKIKEGYYAPYKTSQKRSAIWDFVEDIPFDSDHPTYNAMLDMAARLPVLSNVPVKIIWGLKDPCFHREMLTKVSQYYPNADVMELPEASHLVVEDAAEQVASAISDFLSQDHTQKRQGAQSKFFVDAKEEINVLVSSFAQIAAKYPQNEAVIEPHFIGNSLHYTFTSCAAMQILINKYQRGLQDLGLLPGDKVLMLVTPGVDFLALSYAVMARGAIPIFVDAGMGLDNLYHSIEDMRPDAMICSPKAQILRWLKPNLFRHLKFHVTANEWYPFGPTLSLLKKYSPNPLPPVESIGTALIAFTSGATGTPKGVEYTEKMLKTQLEIFKNTFDIKAGDKDCPLLPIFSLFSMSLGVTSVFPPVNPSKPLTLDPSKIIRLIQDQQINISFGAPTLWTKIAEYCVLSHQTLPSLKKILMAGAPVSKNTLKLLAEVTNGGMSYTPYGATEALPVTFPSATEILDNKDIASLKYGQGVYVGKPIKEVELKIVQASDDILTSANLIELSARNVGEIIVSGDNVSLEYLNRPDANCINKIVDGDKIWHRTGDVGYLDEQGGLYLCGRKAHSVHVNGNSYYSLPIERIFNQHPKVRRSALLNIKNMFVGIAIELLPEYWTEDQKERDKIKQELIDLAQSDSLAKDIKRVYFYKLFPVDGRHNAKIFRDQLSKYFSNNTE